jgi:hypothetical protein
MRYVVGRNREAATDWTTDNYLCLLIKYAFFGSGRRSMYSVETPSETLDKRLDIHPQKGRPSAISRGKVFSKA